MSQCKHSVYIILLLFTNSIQNVCKENMTFEYNNKPTKTWWKEKYYKQIVYWMYNFLKYIFSEFIYLWIFFKKRIIPKL